MTCYWVYEDDSTNRARLHKADMQPLQGWPGYERVAPSRQSVARPFRNRTGSHRLRTEHRPPGCQRVLVLSAGYGKSLIATTPFVPITQSGSACLYRGTAKIMGARVKGGMAQSRMARLAAPAGDVRTGGVLP